MTITLEQIEGMKIPVGTPIEITINTRVSENGNKLSGNETYKKIGYFSRIDPDRYGAVEWTESLDYFPESSVFNESCMVPLIEQIRILKYQD